MCNYDYCVEKVLHLNTTTEHKVEMLKVLLDIKFLVDKNKCKPIK